MRRNTVSYECIRSEETKNSKALKALSRNNKRRNLSGTTAANNNESLMKCPVQMRNHVWSYHFITIQTSDGLPVRIFIIFDEYTQECLRSLAVHNLNSGNVADELFSLFLDRGIPKYLFALDDADLMQKAICEWLEDLEIRSIFVEVKESAENGYGLLVKNKLIRQLFHEKSFASLSDVQLWLANWRDKHNRSINRLRI